MSTDTAVTETPDGAETEPLTGSSDGNDSDYQVGGQNWGPTRLSILLPLAVGVGMVALFSWFVDDLLTPLGIGTLGALAFTSLVWLVDADDEGISTFFASLLTIVVGIGLIGGTASMALFLGAELFPIEDLSFLSLSTLIIVGHVGVVFGCSLVVFGATVGLRNVEMGESLRQSTGIALVTAVIPGSIAITFAALAIASAGYIAGPATFWELAQRVITDIYISTTAEALHLSSFLFLVALFAGGLYVAITVLPFDELLADRGTAGTAGRSFALSKSVLLLTAMGLFLASILWLFVDQSFTPAELRNLLGVTVYDTIQLVTTATGLRLFLAIGVIVSFAVTVAVYGFRRVVRSNVTTLSRRLAALAGGGVITVAGAWVAQPTLTWLVTEIEIRLPQMVAGEFREFTDLFIETYGAETIVLGLLTAVIGLTVITLLVFRLFLFVGYLPNESMGPSVASAGLFIGTVFAATIGTPSWVVLTGIVATFIVWDAGRFGVTMGAEIGRNAPSRAPELVHSAATLIVGVLAAGAAFVLLQADFQLTAPVGTVALLSVIAGLLFILESLR